MAKPTWVDFYNALTAGAKNYSAARSVDNSANLNYSNTAYDAQKFQANGGSSTSKDGHSLLDLAWNNNESAGKRILDVLSRPLYGSANAMLEGIKQGKLINLDSSGALKAAGEGYSGKKKTTYADVNAELDKKGLLGDTTGKSHALGVGALSFIEDVALDPSTYLGVGAFKSAAKGVKAVTGSVKTTGRTARAAEELAKEGAVTVPTKDVATFSKKLTEQQRNYNPTNVFDNIVQSTAKDVTGKVPEHSRVFNVTSAGDASERYMLPGPSADVLSQRALLADLTNKAKGIPQFEYGRAVDQIPEHGFFQQHVEKIPNEVGGVPQVVPKAIAEQTAAKAATKSGDLPVFTPDQIKDPVNRAILNSPNETVHSAYETKKVKDLETGKVIPGKTYFVPAKDAYSSTVGEIRRALSDPRTTPQKRAMLKQMLKNHIETVRAYANSVPHGFRDANEYLKSEYGLAAVSDSKRALKQAESAAPKLEPLPPGPFAPKPTFKEVRTWKAMSPIDKMIFMHTHGQGLSPKHLTYLSQASNAKSFATRLKTIQNMVREGGTKDLNDLADAIETGRIQSTEEPGIPELMAHLNVKSLDGLAKKIRVEQNKLSRAEQKMLGKIKDTNPVTKATLEKENVTKELGPTGLPYAAYSGKADAAIARANEIVAARVKPADEIIKEVKTGNKSSLAQPVNTLDVNQSHIFDNALAFAFKHEVFDPRNKELYAFATRKGVLRTSATPNVGKGRIKNTWNKYSQYSFFKGIMQHASEVDPQIKSILNEAGAHGTDRLAARASAMYELMMPSLKAVDDVLKQGGIFPTADKLASDEPFSLFDVLSSLDRHFVEKNIFTLNKKSLSMIAPTQLMDVMHYLVVSAKEMPVDKLDSEMVRNMLMEAQKTRNGKDVPNGLRVAIGRIKGAEERANVLDDAYVAPIMDALPDLIAKTEKNAAQRKLWHENQVEKGKKASLDIIADTIMDPTTSVGDLAKLGANVEKIVVNPVVRSKGIDENDAWAVAQEIRAAMPDLGINAETAAQGKKAMKIKASDTKVLKTKVLVDEMKQTDEIVGKIFEEEGIPLSDLGRRIEGNFAYKIAMAFSPHLGNAAVRPYFLSRKSFSQDITRGYAALLTDIHAKHASPDIITAFRELQNGTRSAIPEIQSAQDDLSKAINTLFAKDPEYNVFARNNITADDVNSTFNHFQIHEKYQFADETMNDGWRKWDTDNPLDLLSRVQAATMAAHTQRTLGADLSRLFGSATKQEGHVKLSSRNSILASHLDLSLYYPRDVARQFKTLDDFMKKMLEPSKSNDFLRLLDSALHRYKAGLTIYRPGHHVRNQVGDMWLSYMAGVNNPTVYSRAMKIMAENHGRYKDFDAVQALMSSQPVTATAGKFNAKGGKILTARINGKKVDLSSDEVYRAAKDAGLLTDYRTLDDIQMGAESELSTGSKFSEFVHKPRVGKASISRPLAGHAHDKAASFSEARDHYVRLAHFIDYLEKGNFSSLQDAINRGAHEVRKWHPDGSDLSHFEAKVMRRSVLFYSWIRKAIPLVLESTINKPGKVLMYPKAMYNIAEAQGIDLESMSNPFPQDQLFPDWLTEQVSGPSFKTADGHYLGISPGIPAMDIASQYGGSEPGREVLGALNPLFKWPIESIVKPKGAVAADIRTGIPAYDRSDYIDRQIPGFGNIASITGRSPSQGFMQAKGGPTKDPQANPTALFNLLSGLGLVDMSKPAYIKQGKHDAKARYQQRMQGGQ